MFWISNGFEKKLNSKIDILLSSNQELLELIKEQVSNNKEEIVILKAQIEDTKKSIDETKTMVKKILSSLEVSNKEIFNSIDKLENKVFKDNQVVLLQNKDIHSQLFKTINEGRLDVLNKIEGLQTQNFELINDLHDQNLKIKEELDIMIKETEIIDDATRLVMLASLINHIDIKDEK